MKPVEAFVACAQWGRMTQPHFSPNLIARTAREAREKMGAIFHPANPAAGWAKAKSEGWRIRKAAISLLDEDKS